MSFQKEKVIEIAGVLTGNIRLSIIGLLLEKPWNVSDIVDKLKLNQAVISKQLGVLKNAGIVICSPSGRCREYRLTDIAATNEMINSINKMAGICDKAVADEKTIPVKGGDHASN
jgi:predicted transcriptional regulator